VEVYKVQLFPPVGLVAKRGIVFGLTITIKEKSKLKLEISFFGGIYG